MNNYLHLLRETLCEGDKRPNRTGIDTIALFGKSLSFDLTRGFPAVTTKKLFFNSVAAELAGFLEGTTSAARMRELGTNIWNANANAQWWQESSNCRGIDDMGKVYGALWRDFGGVDQLHKLRDTIRNNPYDRRQVVTAWDPAEERQCLPPCHILWQTFVRENKFLDLQFYMRSVDLFLGLPFDIASYALLQHILAKETYLIAGNLTIVMGDAHIYVNHITQVTEQLSRMPYDLPWLKLHSNATIDTFHPSMASLEDYLFHPAIAAPMAV